MTTLLLYIKPTCPWCHEALEFFKEHKVDIQVVDITADAGSRDRLQEISRQGRVPTLQYGEFVVADFGIEELLDALEKAPDIKKAIGL